LELKTNYIEKTDERERERERGRERESDGEREREKADWRRTSFTTMNLKGSGG
jgi:hypothetical protein